MRDKSTLINIDNSNPDYLKGRIIDDNGSGNGTPINEFLYGDKLQFFEKLMNLAGITHNGDPDNESNGYQLIDALFAFATKNNVTHNVMLSSGIISIPTIKLSKLRLNEIFIGVAMFDKTTETKIQGSEPVQANVTINGPFKTGEFLIIRNVSPNLIVNPSDFVIDTLATFFSFENIATEKGFPKLATLAQEDNGTDTNVATSPKYNKDIFIKRVNGQDSGNYLADQTRNGLYPKSHHSIVSSLGSKTRNKGFFGNINAGTAGVLAKSGDITSAVATVAPEGGTTIVTVDLTNPMDNLDYLVKIYPVSFGTLADDADIYSITPKIISTTQFQVAISKTGSQTTAIRVYLEVEQW